MVKMLVVVVIFYSACWLPFNFFWVFNLDWDKRINPYIFSVCHILVQFHSCVNPVIYVWMNSKVRWGCLHAIGMKFYPSLISNFHSQKFQNSSSATVKSNLITYIRVLGLGVASPWRIFIYIQWQSYKNVLPVIQSRSHQANKKVLSKYWLGQYEQSLLKSGNAHRNSQTKEFFD